MTSQRTNFISNLPPDLQKKIAFSTNPIYSNRLRSAAKMSIHAMPLSYSTNNIQFKEAYYNATYIISKHSSVIVNDIVPPLHALIKKYDIIYDNATITDIKKFSLYNKGILLYLQIINKSVNNNYYLYGLAQVFSYKSGLQDLADIETPIKSKIPWFNQIKYRIIELELYKMYVLSYLLKPNVKYDTTYLRTAIDVIKYYDENGITSYVKKASHSQLLCTMFLNYYFWNTDDALDTFLNTFLKYYADTTINPIVITLTEKMRKASKINKIELKEIVITLKPHILKNCIEFMINNELSISQFTPKAIALDLSLIDWIKTKNI